ncbi:hypothetical protein [Streptomyces sp. NPDC097619]|uniref:hypothetical protein n=1 Tax=Streptomyces sp. NPDC097619 TaxID=3157228 RepID=UPI003328CB40
MADDRYAWLDGATADRLLRGEPAGPVGDRRADPAEAARIRAEADRLARTLDSLVPPPLAPGSAELPGEAAALAAFRAARPAAAGPEELTAGPAGPGVTDEAPLTVRLGAPVPTAVRTRPRRGPLRLGLAASVALIAVGGVAAATGSGLMRAPSVAGPAPVLTVTSGPETAGAAGTGTGTPEPGVPADRLRVTDGPVPGVSPGPEGTTPGDGGTGSPDPEGTARHKDGGAPDPGEDSAEGGGTDRSALTGLCRDLLAGKLEGDRRRLLERAARGDRLHRYCERLLGTGPATAGTAGAGDGDDKDDDKDDGGKGSGGDSGGDRGGSRPSAPATPGAGGGKGPLPTLGFGHPRS